MLSNVSTILNATTGPIPAWIRYSQWLTLWFVLMIILCALGTLLNIVLFLSIITSRKLRQGSGVLIAHSIFLDTVICSLSFPVLTASTYMPQFSMPSMNMCRGTMLLFYGVLWRGNWASVLIGINRFVAIFLPHGYKRIRTKFSVIAMISSSWIFAACCITLFLFDIGAVLQSTMPWGACGARPTSSIYDIVITLTSPVPVGLVAFIYVTIFSAVYVRNAFSRRKLEPSTATARPVVQSLQQKRLKTARMMFTSYVWLSLCYLPAPIASSVAPKAYGSNPLLSLFLRMLVLCGYATSPVIYFLMNGEYRKRAQRLFIRVGAIWNPQLLQQVEHTVATELRTKNTTNAVD